MKIVYIRVRPKRCNKSTMLRSNTLYTRITHARNSAQWATLRRPSPFSKDKKVRKVRLGTQTQKTWRTVWLPCNWRQSSTWRKSSSTTSSKHLGGAHYKTSKTQVNHPFQDLRRSEAKKSWILTSNCRDKNRTVTIWGLRKISTLQIQ